MASLPLKWHGGKHYLAPYVIGLMPKHKHYVEPFFGSGAVLFSKPRELVENHSEVVNDIYYELTQFYCVLQDREKFEQFRTIIELTPFSEVEWKYATGADLGTTDGVLNAVRFFIRYRQSRQGLGKNFATLSKGRIRRSMNEQVSSWLSAIDGLIDAHSRLQRVVILCDHALNVIAKEDSLDTFFYLDPPYLHETRKHTTSYTYEMTTEEHVLLLGLLGKLQGKFLLSGYPNDRYDTAAKAWGWKIYDVPIDNKASCATSKEIKTERFWRNY